MCFRDYADVETIIGNAYKLANTNLGISRDYPKEIVDARSELWPLYKSERQKYSKSNVFIRFPAQLVVNGRIAADKFPDWRSVVNGSRNKLSKDDDQTRAGRSSSRTGPSSSRPRNEREVSRDSARSETDDDTREVAMQMDNDQRSQASGSGSDLTASSNRGPRGTDIQPKTVYDEAMGRLIDHLPFGVANNLHLLRKDRAVSPLRVVDLTSLIRFPKVQLISLTGMHSSETPGEEKVIHAIIKTLQ